MLGMLIVVAHDRLGRKVLFALIYVRANFLFLVAAYLLHLIME